MKRTRCIANCTAVAGSLGIIAAAAAGTTAGDDFDVRASTRTVDVVQLLRPKIAAARGRGVPVLLPRRIRPGLRPIHGEGASAATGYTFTIAAGPKSFTCGGANACTIVTFDAQPEQPLVGTRVRLVRGRVGYYTPMSCGASCADPSLSWNERGFMYTISGAIGRPRHMRVPLVAAANAAIAAGPR